MPIDVALHGMGAAVLQHHVTGTRAGRTMSICPVVIRYADGLLVLYHSREQAEQVKAQLREWSSPSRLVFSEEETRITHLDQGMDSRGPTSAFTPTESC